MVASDFTPQPNETSRKSLALMPGQIALDLAPNGMAQWVYTLGMDGTLARFNETYHEVLLANEDNEVLPAKLGDLCVTVSEETEFGMRSDDPVGTYATPI